ncbi:sialate O-acetylesterase [Phenylobacterium sp.]|uniref:sialate O-acetylesterase n=1 Tax=Phenylobacterium sp. TaxID=1871053 RepID=UPI00281178E0|nr:sialate O-acetylesterase [Phenylobacterium sp.]
MAFVVFAGQSNTGGYGMGGWTLSQPWTPDPLTLIWDAAAKAWTTLQPGVNTGYGGQPLAWGPEVQFAREFRALFPNEVLRIVKEAHGGTSLAVDHGAWSYDWSPNSGGELFDRAAATIAEASVAAGGGRPDAVFFGQGEEDAADWGDASAYGGNLAAFIAAVRAEWMGDGAGKVGFFQIAPGWPHAAEVRRAQAAVDQADPNAASFDTLGFALQGDGVHYAAAGFEAIGRSYFQLFQGWRGAASEPGPGPGPDGVSLQGGGGPDALMGGGGADTLLGAAGSDSLGGGEGQDYLRGGPDDDRMSGGGAFDDMHGNEGRDTLAGGDGGDWVVGGQHDDQLFGEEAGDVVLGNLGADLVDGGAGDDVVRGGQGDDQLFGWAGNDFLAGDRGDDTISGGSGADIFHSFGEAGLDRITDFSFAGGDRVRLVAGTTWSVSQAGSDVVVDLAGGARLVLEGVPLWSLGDGWILAG